MFWFTLFLLCIALEIITGTGWLLVISLGALSSAVVDHFRSTLPFLHISQELNIFFFASISILTAIIKYLYDKNDKGAYPIVDAPARYEDIKGKIFTLESDIVNGRGQLLIGDMFSTVETLNGENYPAGTRVIVTGRRGIILKITKAEEQNENKE